MSTSNLELFAIELVVQLFSQDLKNDHSTPMLVLYDKVARREHLNVFYDSEVDHYVICEARNWQVYEEDIIEFGYALATELKEIAAYKSIRDTAGYLVDAAVKDALLPAMIYEVALEEDDN